jgi:hypothetical protein
VQQGTGAVSRVSMLQLGDLLESPTLGTEIAPSALPFANEKHSMRFSTVDSHLGEQL